MRKRLSWSAVLIAASLLLCACSLTAVRGSGRMVSEARDVRGFDRVSLSGSGEVILTQGDGESLTVETDENVMQYVTTDVKGGTLTLGTKSGVIVSPTRLTFTLRVEDLDGISVSGSGDVDAERFDTDTLEIRVSGSGSVRIDELEARDVSTDISGSGDVDLAGQVTEQDVDISGSGKYRAADLRSETASLKISGSGHALVWAQASLKARLSGSGSVDYYGSPTTDVSASGSGKVKGLGGK